ncbi:nitrate/nitrite two-component system sensor histidine kinase NarQ [Motilimonas pumila]|uniref:nitrate/nitrite two-component system sensor histidine kinase NarQ n=1 Tax=Motilimonas pumila TaxID=2303987 RepID=UPI001314D4C7|nr:nitrate/nitrite two-component system sensor histidine kinase NarQ [Motilimonas pumila]
MKTYNRSATKSLRRALLIILTICLAQACLSLTLQSTNLNDAKLVNVAGSLRMQSYRLAHSLLSDDPLLEQQIVQFEDSLMGDNLQPVTNWHQPRHIQQDYNQLLQQWQHLKPLLHARKYQEYRLQVAEFVDQIDDMVLDLQQQSEFKVKLIFLFQSCSILSILFICLYLLQMMKTRIVTPLRQLIIAAKAIQNKQFDQAKVSASDQEIGQLCQAVAVMAQELKHLYLEMEQAVNEKTNALAKAHQNMSFLYQFSQQVSASDLSEPALNKLLNLCQEQLQVSAITLTLCRANEVSRTITVGPQPSQAEAACHTDATLTIGQRQLGQLAMHSQQALDNTVCNNLAFTLAQGLLNKENALQHQKLALMEERAIIARELHDSIAQALSYLRIQCTRLKRQVQQPHNDQALNAIAEEIDQGIAAAYLQLRELLSTFRLQIKEANLSEAIAVMLEQLQEQSASILQLEYQINDHDLKAEHHIHILQIIRESVLNAIKHANAAKILVVCQYQDSHNIAISISDDGQGFEGEQAKQGHYGLSILHERAQNLGGEINIEPRPNSGTLISLVFPYQQLEQ